VQEEAVDNPEPQPGPSSVQSTTSSNTLRNFLTPTTLELPPHNIQTIPKPRQQTITDYVIQKRPLSVDRQKQINDQLTKMIVKGYKRFYIFINLQLL